MSSLTIIYHFLSKLKWQATTFFVTYLYKIHSITELPKKKTIFHVKLPWIALLYIFSWMPCSAKWYHFKISQISKTLSHTSSHHEAGRNGQSHFVKLIVKRKWHVSDTRPKNVYGSKARNRVTKNKQTPLKPHSARDRSTSKAVCFSIINVFPFKASSLIVPTH